MKEEMKNQTKKRRWSLTYKKSINCNRPRGFSQKQYCKYGRKHGGKIGGKIGGKNNKTKRSRKLIR
jgi:hypothetical protein